MAVIEERYSERYGIRYRVKIRKAGIKPLSKTFSNIKDAEFWIKEVEKVISNIQRNRYTLHMLDLPPNTSPLPSFV